MRVKVIQRFLWPAVVAGFTLVGCGSPMGPTANGGLTPPQSSVIDGTVVNTSSQPLSGVRVGMVATGQSATTNGQGHFRLMNVPAGPVQMSVQQGAINTTVTLQRMGTGQMAQVTMQVDGAGNVQVTNDYRTGMPHFDGYVVSVDQNAQTLTLQGGYVVRVDANTVWYNDDNDGTALLSLAQVANALAAGQKVEAEGYGVPDANGVILATQIEVEVDNDADGDND